MRKQLRMGIAIEREHRPTITYIKNYLNKRGRLPSNTKIYKHIALNHLAEHRNYYTKLKKAKL